MTEHIAFLGTGSMNGSIAAGLIAGGYPAEAIRATVRSKNSIDRLRHQLGPNGRDAVVIGCELKPEANREAVSGASVVLLGVKPYGIVELAREISPASPRMHSSFRWRQESPSIRCRRLFLRGSR